MSIFRISIFALLFTMLSPALVFGKSSVVDQHLRTNGSNLDNTNAFIFDCPIIKNGRVAGANTSQLTDSKGDPSQFDFSNPFLTFIHKEAKAGQFQITIPACYPDNSIPRPDSTNPEVLKCADQGSYPTTLQRIVDVDASVLNAFPEIAQYAVPEGQAATHELQIVTVNADYDTVVNKWGGVFKGTAKYKKYHRLEVRCVFLREKVQGGPSKVISCIGCEFFFSS